MKITNCNVWPGIMMVMRIVDKKAGKFMIVTTAAAVHVQLAPRWEIMIN